MSFDLFVQSCISLKKMTDVFKGYDKDRDGYIMLSFEEFLTGKFCRLSAFLHVAIGSSISRRAARLYNGAITDEGVQKCYGSDDASQACSWIYTESYDALRHGVGDLVRKLDVDPVPTQRFSSWRVSNLSLYVIEG